MKVFICWSKPQSKQVAIALRECLPLMLNALEPWVSDKDIGPGTPWFGEIANNLTAATVGIVCVTQENLAETWLHFEAGALANKVGKDSACPYLFRVAESALVGPLSELQCVGADDTGTRRLLHRLNESVNAAGEKGLSPGQLDRAFDLAWPELLKALKQIPEQPTPTEPPRSAESLLEEVLVVVRRLAAQRTPEVGEAALQARALRQPDDDAEIRRRARMVALREMAGEADDFAMLTEALRRAPSAEEIARMREAMLSAAPAAEDVARMQEVLANMPSAEEVARMREAMLSAAPSAEDVARIREALRSMPSAEEIQRILQRLKRSKG